MSNPLEATTCYILECLSSIGLNIFILKDEEWMGSSATKPLPVYPHSWSYKNPIPEIYHHVVNHCFVSQSTHARRKIGKLLTPAFLHLCQGLSSPMITLLTGISMCERRVSCTDMSTVAFLLLILVRAVMWFTQPQQFPAAARYSHSALVDQDYRSIGWVIDPAPEACFIPHFILIAHVVPGPV